MTTIAVAWALLCVPLLQIGVESGPTLRLPLGPDARFSVTYWHSVYDAPLTEYFVVATHEIRLMTVRTPSPKVLEYLALDGAPDTDVAVERRFDSIAFRVATKEPQTLVIGETKRSFRDFGAPGARLVFAPVDDCVDKSESAE